MSFFDVYQAIQLQPDFKKKKVGGCTYLKIDFHFLLFFMIFQKLLISQRTSFEKEENIS